MSLLGDTAYLYRPKRKVENGYMAPTDNKYTPTAEEVKQHKEQQAAAAEAEAKRLAEPKALVSVTHNGFLHQEELLALLQNYKERIEKLEAALAGELPTG